MRPAWIMRILEAEEEAPIPPPREGDRRAAIGAIESAIRLRAARRSRARFVWAFGAAAAIMLAVGLAALFARRGSETARAPLPAPAMSVSGAGVVLEGAPAPSTSAVAIAKGQRLVVKRGGHATLAFATGTELSVDERGDMAVVEEGRSQIFALSSGSMRARVAKLGPGERFVVRTPDAEVEVRGTVFTVSIVPSDTECGDGTITRVAVEEGVVVVRRGGQEVRVAKGERWPGGCESSPAPSMELDSDGSTTSSPAPRAANEPKRKPAPSASAFVGSSSSLAEQNALFAEGLAYKNGGQSAQAVAIFERFIAKYPTSGLAENAAVERMRLLASMDRSRGAAAASQYLRRYPNGFGRAEAKAIVASAP
jgi:hypothetical protein